MIDQATRSYVQSAIENTPDRVGSLESVLVRGRRRRLATRVGVAVSMMALIFVAVGAVALLRPANRPVATGTDPIMLELVSGFAVGVGPDSAESEGAIVYVGLLGPEPFFDTTNLGTEIALTPRPASDLIVPPKGNPLDRNALRAAAMVYLGDINGAQIALSLSDSGFLGLGGESLCAFWGNGTQIAGGGDCYIIEGPKTGTTTDPPIGGWLVWTQLPKDTAAVQVELEDGTRYWQRPVARTVFLNAPDGRSLENAALSAVDSAGNVIQTATPEHTTPPRRSTNPAQ